MKNKTHYPLLLVLLISIQSCAVVGGIFKAGTFTGMMIVLAILVVIAFVFMKIFKK